MGPTAESSPSHSLGLGSAKKPEENKDLFSKRDFTSDGRHFFFGFTRRHSLSRSPSLALWRALMGSLVFSLYDHRAAKWPCPARPLFGRQLTLAATVLRFAHVWP